MKLDAHAAPDIPGRSPSFQSCTSYMQTPTFHVIVRRLHRASDAAEVQLTDVRREAGLNSMPCFRPVVSSMLTTCSRAGETLYDHPPTC